MLKAFRVLSFIEGLSLISLLFIAMPEKYYFHSFNMVWVVGMTHSILWLVYLVLSLSVSHKQGWSVMFWMLVLFISVVPFGCFLLDKNLQQDIQLANKLA